MGYPIGRGRDVVYVIEGNGAVKIGVTGNLRSRLSQLQTGSPYPLRLVHSVHVDGDAYAVEAEAHNLLGRHRLRGEWFSVPADVAVAALSAASYRFGAEDRVPEVSHRARWVFVIATMFTPAWIAQALDYPRYAAPLMIAAGAGSITALVKGGRLDLNSAFPLGLGLMVAICNGMLVSLIWR